MDILTTYHENHPISEAKYLEAKTIFPGGVTHDNRYATPFPLYMTKGEGSKKWDVDGNEYIDYVCGHGALLLGHSHPEIVEAVKSQMSLGTHLGACTDLEMSWGSLIKTLVPSVERIRFNSSGTEATMMAMRLARAYTGKSIVIKLEDHFHGWHDYAISNSSGPGPGVPLGSWGSTKVLPSGNLQVLEDFLTSNDDVAAIILEPTGAHYGQLMFNTQEYLSGVRQLTSAYNVVFIMDEVVTGFRASSGGAQSKYGIIPDLTTFAKIVAGSLPGGAVGGKADIMDMISHTGDPKRDRMERVAHPGTFNANPLSAAAGIKCLEIIAEGQVNDIADKMGLMLKNGINDLFSSMEISGHAYGIGSMIHVVLNDCDCDRETCISDHSKIKNTISSEKTIQLKRSLQNHGIDIMGRNAFLVSGVHTEEDIISTLNSMELSLHDCKKENLLI
jgi:glutamate-1-semialdehyde 2,1-aminomutase